MIYVGIDDTDTWDTPGTNQLARLIIARLAGDYDNVSIVRHQLLDDPRVPYTSKNGSASILLEPRSRYTRAELVPRLQDCMREWYKEGSDPGLCVAEQVPDAIVAFGRKCKEALVEQQEPRELAARFGIHLEGLGGTEGGVIGALAAIGLIATGDDGRVVQLGAWLDDLSGLQPVETVRARGIEVRSVESGAAIVDGTVDVGKHLRPNLREGKVVLFVKFVPAIDATPAHWEAVRFV